ncbi:hypothetical protein PR048_028430 [Dryococelus australis]|uniref:DDE-1 domain-containing protein n=1 Tax=Dryococelus australis TaxID=614101 RepID=A0ABQ9GAI8_9NEOP|nr:hypothetical protein PR048_028430 [Dryococelus australis]
MRTELLHDLPPGYEGHASGTAIKNLPILLLVDNHISHVSLPAINFSRNNNIAIVGYLPHATHRLQPLDVFIIFIFTPLKIFYSQAFNNFMVYHPGQAITDRDVAYIRAATVANAVKGFKACGIEPYSPQIFDEEDFARSATIERDIQAEPSHDQQTIALSGQQAAAVENDLLLQHIIMQPGRSHQQDRQEVVPDEAENRTHISQANYNENVPKRRLLGDRSLSIQLNLFQLQTGLGLLNKRDQMYMHAF